MTPREAVRQPLPVRAVFCNYIVGVLPATIIRQGPDGWEELRVRTWLPESAVESSGPVPSDIQAMIRSDDPVARAKLVALADLVDCETRFVPAPEPGPYWNDVIALSRGAATVVSDGALDCLSACLDAIDDEGFVLLNDHGALSTEQQCTVHYRLGKTLASHVSFPLLDAVASRRGWWTSTPAGEQARALYARLYTDRSRRCADLRQPRAILRRPRGPRGGAAVGRPGPRPRRARHLPGAPAPHAAGHPRPTRRPASGRERPGRPPGRPLHRAGIAGLRLLFTTSIDPAVGSDLRGFQIVELAAGPGGQARHI